MGDDIKTGRSMGSDYWIEVHYIVWMKIRTDVITHFQPSLVSYLGYYVSIYRVPRVSTVSKNRVVKNKFRILFRRILIHLAWNTKLILWPKPSCTATLHSTKIPVTFHWLQFDLHMLCSMFLWKKINRLNIEAFLGPFSLFFKSIPLNSSQAC